MCVDVVAFSFICTAKTVSESIVAWMFIYICTGTSLHARLMLMSMPAMVDNLIHIYLFSYLYLPGVMSYVCVQVHAYVHVPAINGY